MPVLLVVAFIVVPIVELYVLIQVGQLIGVLPTIALLILDSVLGAALVRREGRRTWAAFRDATAQGRLPAKEVADGALVIFGGALLLTPGFTTDVLGLLCILPPTRALLRRAFTGLAVRRLGLGATGVARRAAGPNGVPRGRRPGSGGARARYRTPGDRGAATAASARPWAGPGADSDVVDGDVVEGEIVEGKPHRPDER